jgi:enoyl-CoA hydratase/carnithine racemase
MNIMVFFSFALTDSIKNALNNDRYLELYHLFTLANVSDDIRGVLIQGDEKYFCAGNDLHDLIST